HRYSRTQILFDDFAAAFDLAEEVIITEIYEASEKPIEGITPEALVESVNRRGKTPALHLSDREELSDYLLESLEEGDLLVTLGAGNLNRFSEEFLARLQES
ncbi:MAG: UDP-N-acetylmuramate--L-alanine ligase, partial [Candidatus Krumholzibacteria bacterium]|nr:UDP-N-acetylmuramate--L-alanine ligase [Candidatus Krumholzibacteria bacterium]